MPSQHRRMIDRVYFQILVKSRTALVNRLHALYVQAGETGLKKKDLAAAGSREKLKPLLRGTLGMIAESIERELEVVETELTVYKEKIAEIVRESGLAPYIMSIPGVGPAPAAAFTAYIGDGERFGSAGEAANYAGLTPVLDCSGNMVRYGHIQRGGCQGVEECHFTAGMGGMPEFRRGTAEGKVSGAFRTDEQDEERGGWPY